MPWAWSERRQKIVCNARDVHHWREGRQEWNCERPGEWPLSGRIGRVLAHRCCVWLNMSALTFSQGCFLRCVCRAL
eukprot:3931671-Rhodomonas_salina.1